MTFSNIFRSENCLLVLEQINQALPTNLQNMFKFSENQHTHNTRTAKIYKYHSLKQTQQTMDYTQSLTKLQKIGTLFKIKSILTSLKIIYHRINS